MPVSPTITAPASQVPEIQISADAQTLASALIDSETSPAPLVSLRPFWTGMRPQSEEGYVLRMNWNAKAVELVAKYGGAGAHAVAYGLEISDEGGLLIAVSTGLAMIDAPIEHISAIGNQVTLLDNESSYVWLKNNGALDVVTSSLTPPSPESVYLGRVDTAGGVITEIDISGVWKLSGGVLFRETGDLRDPEDTPQTVRAITFTQTETYMSDGAKYTLLPRVGEQVRIPSNGAPEALTTTKVLTKTSPNQLNFKCAAQQKVLAPPDADVVHGMWWQVFNYNAGGGANILLRDSEDTITIATIGPGQNAPLPVVDDGSGTPYVPQSAIVSTTST